MNVRYKQNIYQWWAFPLIMFYIISVKGMLWNISFELKEAINGIG